jgi:sulfoxide reductase heme-binding subunit YedZ
VNPDLLWFTGRGSGVMSLVLLTVVMVLGIVGRSGRSLPGLPRFTVADVHRNASLIALGLVLVHLIVLWMDPYAHLRVFDLLVPFDATYRPLWVGLGTLSFEILAVLVVTSLLRQRIGARVWKLVHWLSYGLWPIAWLHGWFSGTDAASVWFKLITLGCLVAVGGAVAWRLSPRFLEIPRPRPTNPASAAMTPTGTSTAVPTAASSAGGLVPPPRHSAPDATYAADPVWQPDPTWRTDPSWHREPTWHGQPPEEGWRHTTQHPSSREGSSW